MTLYPFDAPTGLTPVKVYSDENCFNRSISFSLFGCEKHYGNMRVRTLFELVHNEKWYSNAEVLGKMSESAFLISYFYESSLSNESRVTDNATKSLQNEIL